MPSTENVLRWYLFKRKSIRRNFLQKHITMKSEYCQVSYVEADIRTRDRNEGKMLSINPCALLQEKSVLSIDMCALIKVACELSLTNVLYC